MSTFPSRHPEHNRRKSLIRDRIETSLKGKTISGATSTGNSLYINFADGTNLSITAVAKKGDAKLLFYDGNKQWSDD